MTKISRQDPDSLSLRLMTADDLTAVLELEGEGHAQPWTGEQFLRELENPLATIDLAILPEGPAGFLCSWLVAGELEIHNVVTAANRRRQGIARALLEHRLNLCRRQGMARVFLEVRVGNEAAISLYRRFGFQRLDRRQGYYADGEDALVMVLEEREPRI